MPLTRDPLFFPTADYCAKRASITLFAIKRKFNIGHARAATLIEQLKSACVIGEFRAQWYNFPVLADKKFIDDLKAAAEELP
ncbi:MAG: hypothetical protein KDB65_13405 [Calditrichaeota bacterium]|nr:hypothetical protein [Calditrichota bacterium]